jgi:hypothetical protein
VTADGGVTLVRGLDSVIRCMESSGPVSSTTAKGLGGQRSVLQGTHRAGHNTAGTGTLGRVMSSMQVCNTLPGLTSWDHVYKETSLSSEN